MKVAVPARACERSCKVPEIKPGASEVNRPNRAKATAAATAAA
jgi:hypothetical protein